MKKLLIIGSCPPPIGGVVIHVKRLLDSLQKDNIALEYIDLKKHSKYDILKAIFTNDIIHLHTSSPYIRFIIVLLVIFFLKKIIITIHGNLNRFNFVKNSFDHCSILLANHVILLNKQSIDKAKKISKKTSLISAFIPPEEEHLNCLDNDILLMIKQLRRKYSIIFCTNAFNISFDKDGTEIYGISKLISIFFKLNNKALIISDPSGEYLKYVKEQSIHVPDNIYFINYQHEFFNIIKLSDILIRATTTDGDSLSVKEALYLNKNVIASDCVSRPSGCVLYKNRNFSDLQNIISNFDNHRKTESNREVENGYIKIKELYFTTFGLKK